MPAKGLARREKKSEQKIKMCCFLVVLFEVRTQTKTFSVNSTDYFEKFPGKKKRKVLDSALGSCRGRHTLNTCQSPGTSVIEVDAYAAGILVYIGKQISWGFGFFVVVFSNAFILRHGEFLEAVPPSSGQQTTWVLLGTGR